MENSLYITKPRNPRNIANIFCQSLGPVVLSRSHCTITGTKKYRSLFRGLHERYSKARYDRGSKGRLRQNLTFNVFLVSCNVCTYIPQPFPFGPLCWMKMTSCIAILFKSLARIVVFIISWRHCNTQLFSGKNTFILIDLMMQPMSVPV